MDKSRTEKLAVNHLEKLLLNCSKIDSDIKTNDKTVSWDGEIYLYSSESKRKDSLIGKCNVQVKGHSCKCKEELDKSEVTFYVSCADLKNYVNDGGVIYFVVYMLENDTDTKKIYYNSLLPYDIDRYLKVIKPEQKTKAISFEEFPKEEREIECLIKDFLFHRKKQYSTHAIDNAIFPLNKNESYKVWFNANESILNGKSNYVYRQLSENVFMPAFKCKFTGVKMHSNNIDVSIDNTVYFRDVQVTWENQNVIKTIILNHGLNITGLGKKRSKIQLKKNCSIHEYIENLKFMIALKTGKELKIGEIACGNCFDVDDDAKDLEYELSTYEKIEHLLSVLNVKKIIMVSKISRKMINDLLTLYQFIVLKEHHLLTDGKSKNNVGKVNIGPYNFFLIKLYNEIGEAIIINPFDNHLKCEMSLDGEKRFESSFALWLSEKEYDLFDNVNYDAISRSVTELPYCDDLCQVVSRTILILLNKYDKEKEKAILECVTSISKWLYDNNGDIINLLNYLQCIYRMDGLEKNHQNELIELKRKYDDNNILAGINILLGNKSEFSYYFDKMNSKDRKLFKTYPIYNLLNTM